MNWSREEEARLLALAKSGSRDQAIAKVLGRSVSSVTNKLFLLRNKKDLKPAAKPKLQPRPKHKTLRCLGCPRSFKSSGPGNRICGWCKAAEAKAQGLSWPKASEQSKQTMSNALRALARARTKKKGK